MRLQILTPDKTAFDGEVESVLAPGAEGMFEVLKDHAPILAALKPGDLRITANSKPQHFHVTDGFFEFSHNQGVILADALERPGEIDAERVRLAKEKAQKLLDQKSDVDIVRAEKALMRALSRERFVEKYPR